MYKMSQVSPTIRAIRVGPLSFLFLSHAMGMLESKGISI